jgi:hypothetical protein
MAWGTYMLRSSVVSVFIHCRVKARKNTSRFEMMHRTREKPTTVNGVRQPAAKVKKEPDTELLISPALKEKILLKEGVDLKRLNQEYQEKKGYLKVNQETRIYNQKPFMDRDVDEDEITNLHLSEHFSQEWSKQKWYSVSAIASKLGIHRKTVVYWRDIGIKIKGIPIRLKMIKKPFHWYSKGKWIIEFFLKTNADVDMDGT